MKKASREWVWVGLITVLATAILGFYQPRVTAYRHQVSDLTQQVTALDTENAVLSTANSVQRQEIALLETQKAGLSVTLADTQKLADDYKSQAADLAADVESLNSRVGALASQVSELQSEEASLQKRFDSVMDITVTQHYDWLNAWTWELPIPLSLYIEYRERPRPSSVGGFVELARDPGDDAYIDQMVAYIDGVARQYHFTDTQKVNFVITFVQSLPYTTDSVTAKADEYPRYPVETLFDRGGDCEDTAILVAAILDRMGHNVALLHLPGHMAVGIALPGATGRYYDHNGVKYFYLETTGEGWRIGDMPAEYITANAFVYPLSR